MCKNNTYIDSQNTDPNSQVLFLRFPKSVIHIANTCRRAFGVRIVNPGLDLDRYLQSDS